MSIQLENVAKLGIAHHNGMPILSNKFLTIPEEQKRSIKEILFTRPWHPFKRYNIIQVPNPECYLMNFQGKKTLMGHPDTLQPLIESVKEIK